MQFDDCVILSCYVCYVHVESKDILILVHNRPVFCSVFSIIYYKLIVTVFVEYLE